MQLSTKDKCVLRDLIKIEIKSCRDDLLLTYDYVQFLFKLGKKLRLDPQQKIKENKLYNK
jgi:hypothetical protein